jgi:hypothetical protein
MKREMDVINLSILKINQDLRSITECMAKLCQCMESVEEFVGYPSESDEDLDSISPSCTIIC